jgi:phytoene synthase
MQSDVMSSSFKTWRDLYSYMQGASVAPAVIFMYLVLMRPDPSGRFQTTWSYPQVHAATEDLAIFCYCVHILRDVADDLTVGESGLVYLPADELARFGIIPRDLYKMRERGSATDQYKQMAGAVAERARRHLAKGREHMAAVVAAAEPESGSALETLVNTYDRILNELQDRQFDVFSPAKPS